MSTATEQVREKFREASTGADVTLIVLVILAGLLLRIVTGVLELGAELVVRLFGLFAAVLLVLAEGAESALAVRLANDNDLYRPAPNEEQAAPVAEWHMPEPRTGEEGDRSQVHQVRVGVTA
ncbi:hypothetical protein D5S17_28990 [Pseudonocardiaceae bacterium YIM PH 21723]|nr:hypothetical protein D5S17_28990 [Pseudonocardiaceae bacterium YIM PH 21723]